MGDGLRKIETSYDEIIKNILKMAPLINEKQNALNMLSKNLYNTIKEYQKTEYEEEDTYRMYDMCKNDYDKKVRYIKTLVIKPPSYHGPSKSHLLN